ncbi:MAG: hypothetical protein HDR05_12575 [Lachnospiraceae bacterium]|nr:hypothetical protein [Lachnospiraceae bacterium]
MILNIYKVNRQLPEQFIINALECNRIWDIDPGVYKVDRRIEVEYTIVDDLIEAIENKRIEVEKSDIIEMLPDENMLNNDLGIQDQCNFLIMTGLGVERIAIDKEAVFRDISLSNMRELFAV